MLSELNSEKDIAHYLRNRETDLALPVARKHFGKICFKLQRDLLVFCK